MHRHAQLLIIVDTNKIIYETVPNNWLLSQLNKKLCMNYHKTKEHTGRVLCSKFKQPVTNQNKHVSARGQDHKCVIRSGKEELTKNETCGPS